MRNAARSSATGRQVRDRVPRQARQATARPRSTTAGWPGSCRRCQDLPGRGAVRVPRRRRVSAGRSLGGRERLPARDQRRRGLTAKDFRTWGASASACGRSATSGPPAAADGRAPLEHRGDPRWSPRRSATRRPSAARPTSTRRAGGVRRRRPPARRDPSPQGARPLGVGSAQVPARGIMTRRRPPARWSTAGRRARGSSGSRAERPRRAYPSSPARP